MASKKIQLYTDRANTIEASPETSANCVILSDGNDLQKVLDNDLTNPTVVHEETSFKVGVGDINVSSSVVDGEVGRMVIKGKTYQNILPEPSTHVLTNNKEMFKVNEGLDPNVEIVDGVSKSAILKGQTLVNLLDRNNMSLESLEYTFVDGIFNVTTDRDWGKMKFNPALISNKKYILFIGSSVNNCMIYYRVAGGVATSIGHAVNAPIIFTTPSDQIVSISIEFPTAVTNGTVLYPMLLEYQEGMENWDIPYFEGMQSVKMPVLTTVGKNLFDSEKAQSGYLGSDPYGINRADHSNKTSDYIRVKPNTSYTYSLNGFTASQVGSEYWTGWYYYTSPTEVSKKNMNRQVSRGSADTFKTVTFTTPSDCYYVRIGSRGLALDGATVQLEEGSTATSYEPHKSNILSTPEDLVLRKVGDVEDTLDLVTGEYVQRISDSITLTGTENSWWCDSSAKNFYYHVPNPKQYKDMQWGKPSVYCDKYPSFRGVEIPQFILTEWGNNNIRIYDETVGSLEAFKEKLKTNPITLQYLLAEPIVKTVDLSTSGNWEKVVLNGSEDWAKETLESGIVRWRASLPNAIGNAPCYCDKLPVYPTSDKRDVDYVRCSTNLVWVYQKDTSLTPEQFRAKLQSNPLTVWYQVKTHQDSTQVKQPIFFKDGHIQLSSGADNSLIPTLDYEAKTSNSYVMDLMKTNTRYTMKAKSASGTFTIDGTSYGAGTNGTFTTPTSMTNKLLVMSDTAHEEVMIIEGDVTSKAIPYFKGIKSAFEDESKIEVLSCGKNLFDTQKLVHYGAYSRITVQEDKLIFNDADDTTGRCSSGFEVYLKKGSMYILSLHNKVESVQGLIPNDYVINATDGSTNGLMQPKYGKVFTCNLETGVYRIRLYTLAEKMGTASCQVMLEEVYSSNATPTAYEPYKSNSTKIPLLSPLRSLPNGVCDELIIDRMKKKATLIQRVGHVILGQGDSWGAYEVVGDTMKVGRSILPDVKPNGQGMSTLIPYTFNSVSQPNEGVYIYRHASSSEARVRLKLKRTGRHDAVGMQNWLRDNNIITLYELETPIVTEIDLESFPLVYKDGHIFLNSEIAPVVEIDYNVNQSQQIQANNETLQRHELDILDLDNLIVSFVNAEYNLRLLKFDMELSMMALAE